MTEIIEAAQNGNPNAASELLPIVYDELRRLAAQQLSQERPGQTLSATALVHEAYLRLVCGENPQLWQSRGHFFGAAAEAMRRILVEGARRKARKKHGGSFQRVQLDELNLSTITTDDRLLAIDEALDRLAKEDPQAAELVKLRFFAGFSITEAADLIRISRTSAYAQWAYARAWLRCEVDRHD